MEILKYVYKPVFVEAVFVTSENMEEVARWCGGRLVTQPSRFEEGKDATHIAVDVLRPLTPRQAMAFSGDYVIKLERNAGWKVYTKKAHHNTFDLVAKDAEERPIPAAAFNAG